MRNAFLFAGVVTLLFACENQINEEVLIPSDTNIIQERFYLEDASTIRIDSFPTSTETAFSLSNDTSKIILGKIFDDVTGTVEATPYFHLLPAFSPVQYSEDYVYDSLIMVLNNPVMIAGDTNRWQTYHLYRLAELPSFNEDFPWFYSNNSVPLGEKIATLNIVSRKENLKYSYFKIEGDLGQDIFNMIMQQEEILYHPWPFIRQFKGFAIVSDDGNTNLLSANRVVSLRCCYHMVQSSDNARYFDFTNDPNRVSFEDRTISFYTFTNFNHKPLPALESISQNSPALFDDLGFAVIQGLNGYMLQFKLPTSYEIRPYRTIVRVEIELKPSLSYSNEIFEPNRVTLFQAGRDSMIYFPSSADYGMGSYIEGAQDPYSYGTDERRFVIDITDLYDAMSSGGNMNSKDYTFYVGLPGFTTLINDRFAVMAGKINSSFNRLVIREKPELIIYSIQYR